MPILRRWGIGLWLTGLSAIFPPTPALAQSGFYVTPSFSIAEAYNDNLFYTASDRKRDFITRLSPGLLGGYESAPLALVGGYTFDGEIFARRSNLNTAMGRQQAALDFRSLPTPLLTASVKGEYTETQTPEEFNVLTGLATGRVRAHRFLLDPSLSYRFDPLTTGTLAYAFTKDDRSGGVTTDTHTGRLGLDRHITPRDTGSIEVAFNQFTFDREDTTRSHIVALGWTHRFTPLITFMLRGGPRISGGSVDPEVSASIRRRLKEGELSLVYTRSQTTVVGESGTVTADNVALTARYHFLPSVELSAAASFSHNRRSILEANVYRMNLEAHYRITRWLSLTGSYQFSFQKGVLDLTRRRQEISQNVISLKFVVTDRLRVY